MLSLAVRKVTARLLKVNEVWKKGIVTYFEILFHTLPASVIKTTIYSVQHDCGLKILCGTSTILTHSQSLPTEGSMTMDQLNVYGKYAPNFRWRKFTKSTAGREIN
jgi:hypothetical protein